MWLQVQGKGQWFKTGQHSQLTEYLGVACPLSDDTSATQVRPHYLHLMSNLLSSLPECEGNAFGSVCQSVDLSERVTQKLLLRLT